MATTANIRLCNGGCDFWFRRETDGFLAVVGADLIRVYEGLHQEHANLAAACRREPRQVGVLDVCHVFAAWRKVYRPGQRALASALFCLDLGRAAGDVFGHAETGEFQTVAELQDNVMWFDLAQFRSQVNDERAFLERAVTAYRQTEPGAYPGITFPPV